MHSCVPALPQQKATVCRQECHGFFEIWTTAAAPSVQHWQQETVQGGLCNCALHLTQSCPCSCHGIMAYALQ